LLANLFTGYERADCDGFFYGASPTGYGLIAFFYGLKLCTPVNTFELYPGFTTSSNCNNYNSVPYTQLLVQLGVTRALGAYSISRTVGYNCQSYSADVFSAGTNHSRTVAPGFLDVIFYYFNDPVRRIEIDAYSCSETACFGGSCWLNTSAGFEHCSIGYANIGCPNGDIQCFAYGFVNDGTTNLYQYRDPYYNIPAWWNLLTYIEKATGLVRLNQFAVNAYKHWVEVGHKKRYPPSPYCTLYPSLYDSGDQCREPTPGCWTTPSNPTGIPCNSPTNGFCVKDYGAAYGSCQCNAFDNSFGIFAGEERFFGTACEYDSLLYTQTPGSSVSSICGGIGHVVGIATNVTYQSYTPDWYLPAPDRFPVSIQTELPQCDCENTGFVGSQCQLSICGGCGANYLQGICAQKLRPDNTTGYVCVCGPGYTGVHCELAIPKLVGANGLTCSGVASVGCIPNPANPSAIDLDCTTHLNAVCLCTAEYPPANPSDLACSGYACNATVLVPGHGR
jgi:hypothetical protein